MILFPQQLQIKKEHFKIIKKSKFIKTCFFIYKSAVKTIQFDKICAIIYLMTTKKTNILYSVLAVLVIAALLGVSLYFLLPRPEKLEISATDILLKVDESKLIEYDINKKAQVVFDIQDKSIAQTSNFKIIGKKAGETSLKITAIVGKEVCEIETKVVVIEKNVPEEKPDDSTPEISNPPKESGDTNEDKPNKPAEKEDEKPGQNEGKPTPSQPQDNPEEDLPKPPTDEQPSDPSDEQPTIDFDLISIQNCDISGKTINVTAGVNAMFRISQKCDEEVAFELCSSDVSISRMIGPTGGWIINTTVGGTIQVKVDGVVIAEIVVQIK